MNAEKRRGNFKERKAQAITEGRRKIEPISLKTAIEMSGARRRAILNGNASFRKMRMQL